MLDLKLNIDCRIFENQHLLDATEIFRKLNVHKKVLLPFLSGIYDVKSANQFLRSRSSSWGFTW